MEFFRDSLAQSFKLEQSRFITGLNLYFSYVDPNDSITIQIRNTINGYPGDYIYDQTILQNPVYSSDATIPTFVKFKPTFIDSSTYYCFVIFSNSKNTRLFISRIGQQIIGSTITQEKQPTLGSCFSSQNGITWTAQQSDDIKYDLFAAKFKSNSGTLVFKSKQKKFDLLTPMPLESEINSSLIRVYKLNHGLNPGDTIHLRMFSSSAKIKVNIPVGSFLTKGHIITSTTGSAEIIDIFPCTACNSSTYTNVQIVHLHFLNGYFADSQSFTTNSFQDAFYNSISTVTGTIITGFRYLNLNGFSQEKLIKQHVVSTVDSVNSFIIDVGSNASASGRFGPSDVFVLSNFKFDLFNFTGHVTELNSSINWSANLLTHGQTLGPLESKNKVAKSSKSVKKDADMFLEEPSNYYSNLNSSTPLQFTGQISSNDLNYSPILNISTFNTKLVSNSVSLPFLNMNVSPNSSGRFIAETDPIHGTELYKYVSKTVVLQNPAYDLRILLDLYLDDSADFKIYFKKLDSTNASTRLDDLSWTELTGFKLPKQNSRNLADKLELDFVTSDLGIVGWDNKPFITFKIKLVGNSSNTCKVPTIQNLRIIALT